MRSADAGVIDRCGCNVVVAVIGDEIEGRANGASEVLIGAVAMVVAVVVAVD
jgi:hypothetical protein